MSNFDCRGPVLKSIVKCLIEEGHRLIRVYSSDGKHVTIETDKMAKRTIKITFS